MSKVINPHNLWGFFIALKKGTLKIKLILVCITNVPSVVQDDFGMHKQITRIPISNAAASLSSTCRSMHTKIIYQGPGPSDHFYLITIP